jgi:hypothetical protein
VLGGEEVDAFGVVDMAVFCDVVGADGVVDVKDDGFAVEGFGVEFRGAGDERGEDDGGERVVFGGEAGDVGEADFAFLRASPGVITPSGFRTPGILA